MTRINTNVSSLVAQNNLAKSNSQLQTALTRLSTGLKINTGKDDPAGLIASEALKADITSTNAAIGNSESANQMIATADSALSQVSTLLNDVRGLITEAANTGSMSDEQIAANQLQIDSSLDAINRIAQVTSFQGKRLLDGSLDFITSNWVNSGLVDTSQYVADMQITSANLGSAASMSVSVDVQSAATKASLHTTIPATGGSDATADATITLANGSFDVNAPSAGTQWNGVHVRFATDSGTVNPTASYSASSNTLTITVSDSLATTATAIKTAVERDTSFTVDNIVASGSDPVAFDPTTDHASDVAATKATGQITFSDGTIIDLEAITADADFNGNIVFVESAMGDDADPTVDWDLASNTLTITVDDNSTTTAAQVAGAINNAAAADHVFNATVIHNGGTGYDPTVDHGTPVAATFASGAFANANGNMTIYSSMAGAAGNVSITWINDTVGSASWSNATHLTVHVVDGESMGAIASRITNATNTYGGANLQAISANPTGTYDEDDTFVDASLTGGADAQRAANTTTSGGADAISGITADLADGGDAGGLVADLVFQLSGSSGTQIFNFDAGATIDDIEAAIDLVSDATGITARVDGTTLYFESAEYGSDAFVSVDVVSEGTSGTFKSGLRNAANVAASRADGTDIVGKINGVTATGDGNTLSINTSTLAMSVTLTHPDDSPHDVQFTIDGGGALFQLGPDVVSNQQARLGISSVNTATLGGVSGRLYQLGTGGEAALATDATLAGQIVDEVITKVTSLRGRLGAFQATTVESNINSLTETLTNLTSAQSQITDADFAAETANLTRAQILVQAGTSVLSLANQAPQNVLALLQ